MSLLYFSSILSSKKTEFTSLKDVIGGRIASDLKGMISFKVTLALTEVKTAMKAPEEREEEETKLKVVIFRKMLNNREVKVESESLLHFLRRREFLVWWRIDFEQYWGEI